MSHLQLVWNGLWRKPVRTGLTFASMTIAFLLSGLLDDRLHARAHRGDHRRRGVAVEPARRGDRLRSGGVGIPLGGRDVRRHAHVTVRVSGRFPDCRCDRARKRAVAGHRRGAVEHRRCVGGTSGGRRESRPLAAVGDRDEPARPVAPAHELAGHGHQHCRGRGSVFRRACDECGSRRSDARFRRPRSRRRPATRARRWRSPARFRTKTWSPSAMRPMRAGAPMAFP